MKKTLSIIGYVVLAAVVIGAGVWYNHKSDVAEQAAEAQAGMAIQQQQAQLMQELTIKDTTVGGGATAQNGDTVTVNYTGTLDDGTIFDSSLNPGRTPFSFTLGARQVIQGWDLGVVGMKVGGTRTLVIPPNLGYGAQGQGPIPANATLHFTIQLLSVSTSSPTSTGQ